VRGIRVRLLGVTASNLGDREQLSMFSDEIAAAAGRRRGYIRRRCGDDAVTRAAVGAGLPAPFERDPHQPAGPPRPGRPGRSGPSGDPDGRDTRAVTDGDDIPDDEP
jgi:hypothetical protein